MNPNRLTLQHIIIKMAKVKEKERILKAAREKQSHIKGHHGNDINIFLYRSLAAQREWHDIFKLQREKPVTYDILL